MRSLVIAIATVAVTAVFAAGPSGATTATTTEGRTAVAIPPSTTGALVGNGIVPVAVGGALAVAGLTGYAPALGVRTTIFHVDRAQASIDAATHRVVVSNVGVTLDAGAAAALDRALGTTLFNGGLPIGSATSSLRRR